MARSGAAPRSPRSCRRAEETAEGRAGVEGQKGLACVPEGGGGGGMERLPSLPSASLFLFLSLLSIGLDLSRPCKREGGRSEGERELAVGWGGDRSVMSPESGESPGKVIGALDVLNVQISAKKCALALPAGAGMEAALRPLCKVQEPAPGCFTSRPGCCGGGGGGGRAVAGGRAAPPPPPPTHPRHRAGLQSLAGAPLRRGRAARGARWGGRRRPVPASPSSSAVLPFPPPPGRSPAWGVVSPPPPRAERRCIGRRPPRFQVGGRERRGSWQAVGETQPNFDLRHPVRMPKLRTSLATLPVPEKKEGESRN